MLVQKLFLNSRTTWSEGDADVLWGHLCTAEGGVDLHLDLWALQELQSTASPAQVHWQITAMTWLNATQEVLWVKI